MRDDVGVTVMSVGERRLQAGGGPAYLAATRKLSEALAHPVGRHDLRVAVADDDPDHVLVLARWDSQAAFDAAVTRVPVELRTELASLERGLADPTWHWYTVEHEIQDMGARPTYVVAVQFRLPDLDRPDVRSWMDAMMEGTARLPGVASVARLSALRSVDPVLVVLQYAAPDTARGVQQLLANLPPPLPLSDWARFAGRIDLHWDRGDPSG
jgi:quinol monooxygenase YgiN